MTTRRSAFGAAVALAVTTTLLIADARATSARFQDLALSPPMTSPAVPKQVDGRERAAGFVIMPTNDGVFVVGTESEATAWSRGETDTPPSRCFQRHAGTGAGLAPPLTTRVLLPKRDGVALVRSQRFVDGPAATLEIATAFVDPSTRGVHLVSTTRLALTRVATTPAEVFAARSGASGVRFFVRGAQLEARLPGGARIATSCGHMELTLDAANRAGEMATVGFRSRSRSAFVHLSVTALAGEVEPSISVVTTWGVVEREPL